MLSIKSHIGWSTTKQREIFNIVEESRLMRYGHSGRTPQNKTKHHGMSQFHFPNVKQVHWCM